LVDVDTISTEYQERLEKRIGMVETKIKQIYDYAQTAPYQEGLTVTAKGSEGKPLVEFLSTITGISESYPEDEFEKTLAERIKAVRNERTFYEKNKGVMYQYAAGVGEGLLTSYFVYTGTHNPSGVSLGLGIVGTVIFGFSSLSDILGASIRAGRKGRAFNIQNDEKFSIIPEAARFLHDNVYLSFKNEVLKRPTHH